MSKETLITTREAAAILNITPSTIKRWADEGTLECVRTVGRHRRFRLQDIQRLREQPLVETKDDPFVDRWVSLLISDRPQEQVTGTLLKERGELGSWHAVCDCMGRVLMDLGQKWVGQKVSILEEHLASERLQRAVVTCATHIPLSPGAPRALLLTAVGDEHTLGLTLAELVLRENGWACVWTGRNTPTRDVASLVKRRGVDMVVLSGSSISQNADVLRVQVREIATAATVHAIPVVMGGSARWPEPPPNGYRFTTYGELHRLLSKSAT